MSTPEEKPELFGEIVVDDIDPGKDPDDPEVLLSIMEPVVDFTEKPPPSSHR